VTGRRRSLVSAGLRRRVQELGLTQSAAAERAGMSQAQFYRLLWGGPPTLVTAMRVAEALGAPVESLWALTAPEEPLS
jgi:transcriptional regulator with XRE-family HTH domain